MRQRKPFKLLALTVIHSRCCGWPKHPPLDSEWTVCGSAFVTVTTVIFTTLGFRGQCSAHLVRMTHVGPANID